MISAGDFRNGATFELDGQVLQVVEFQHVKPGKGFCPYKVQECDHRGRGGAYLQPHR